MRLAPRPQFLRHLSPPTSATTIAERRAGVLEKYSPFRLAAGRPPPPGRLSREGPSTTGRGPVGSISLRALASLRRDSESKAAPSVIEPNRAGRRTDRLES